MFTDFQKKVWQVCRKIPGGKVTTYRELARAVGRPVAFRAVGQALNKNPYAPKIPCHRVIRKDGKIGGYAGGVNRKIGLLIKEGIKLKKGRVEDLTKYFYKLR